MIESKVTVSPAAKLKDFSKLSTGSKRANTALSALSEEKLSPTQVRDLFGLARRYEAFLEEPSRTNNRRQDDPKILAKLGFNGAIPTITPALIAEATRTNGTLVLDFGVSLVEYAKKLNVALGRNKTNLHMKFLNGAETTVFATEVPGGEPQWKVVPNTVWEGTHGLSKVAALRHIPGGQTCAPREIAMMLGYHNLHTNEQMFGFQDQYTLTSERNVAVGSFKHGISVLTHKRLDGRGYHHVGFAPRFAPESN